MRRQRRLDVLFVLVLAAAMVMLTIVYLRKAADCSARGGALVVYGRALMCRTSDGVTIPV